MDDDRGNESSNSGDGSDFEMITQTTQPSQTQSQTQPTQSQSDTQLSQRDDGEAGGESKAGSKARAKEVRAERGWSSVSGHLLCEHIQHDGPWWPRLAAPSFFFFEFFCLSAPGGTTAVLLYCCVSCLALGGTQRIARM